MLVPFGAYGAWTLGVGAWLHPTDAGSSSPLSDATRQLALPFDAFPTRSDAGGVPRFRALHRLVGGRVAAPSRPARDRAIWLGLDALLLVTAATAVAEDTLNLARLTPLAIPGIALAIGMNRSTWPQPTAGDDQRTGSAAVDLVG